MDSLLLFQWSHAFGFCNEIPIWKGGQEKSGLQIFKMRVVNSHLENLRISHFPYGNLVESVKAQSNYHYKLEDLLYSICNRVSLVCITSVAQVLNFEQDSSPFHGNNQSCQNGQKHRPLQTENQQVCICQHKPAQAKINWLKAIQAAAASHCMHVGRKKMVLKNLVKLTSWAGAGSRRIDKM